MCLEKILTELKQQEALLLKLKKVAEKQLSEVPEGNLKIRERRGKPEYYIVPPDGKEKYLRKEQLNLACNLAQKSYLNKFLIDITKQLDTIQQFLKKYSKKALSASYQELSHQRKNLVKPIYLTDEQFIEQWKNQEYIGKGFANNDEEMITKQGERVRSKSEKFIADLLFDMEIPYKYECPLTLNPYGIVYPDFTLLNIHTRQEIILEHLGMMDNPEYSVKAQRKIETYIKNGYMPGKNLILTFESSKRQIDMRIVEMCIKDAMEYY